MAASPAEVPLLETVEGKSVDRRQIEALDLNNALAHDHVAAVDVPAPSGCRPGR